MANHLHTVARRLIGAQTEEQICHTVEDAISRLTGAEDTIFALPEGSLLAGCGCSSTESFIADDHRALVDDLVCQAYTTGEPCVIDDLTDVRSASVQSTSSESDRYRSLLCIPVDGWGVLVAVDHVQGAFSQEDLAHVEQLESYAVEALDRIATPEDQRGECELLEEIADILTHDVRNPLMVAHGQLELAVENRNSEHLEKIATAHDRLEELIGDVATLARTGERIEVTEDVEIRTVAERAWTTVRTQQATLEVVDSTTIVADANGLCQLFENLFRNAVVHGGSTVTVRVGLLEEGDGLYVEDDGVGPQQPVPFRK